MKKETTIELLKNHTCKKCANMYQSVFGFPLDGPKCLLNSTDIEDPNLETCEHWDLDLSFQD